MSEGRRQLDFNLFSAIGAVGVVGWAPRRVPSRRVLDAQGPQVLTSRVVRDTYLGVPWRMESRRG